MVYPHASVGQHKREGGREGERDSERRRGEGSQKGQRKLTERRKIQLRAASAMELHTSLVVVHVLPRPNL